MYKLAGGLLIICSTVFVFSQRIFENYFTYKFLYSVFDIMVKIQYENGSNMPYSTVYKKIGFDYSDFIARAKTNGYVKRSEIEQAEIFFDNLGKRDKNSEKEYIEYNRLSVERKFQSYYSKYNEIKKSHLMCGIASGMLIIIFFI